ncbi:hypothetical protein [Pedobacter suwonensis]|uniref:hypothetical protein n=1 Tax=Pedobacter suwonensis TaxID=332999 RepID=UPI003CFE4B27
MAEHTPRPDQPRLRPAPLLFEPAQAASDPEHFFDLESIEDPRALLERATELTLAFRAAADRATEFQAMAAAQLADPRRFDRLSTADIAERAECGNPDVHWEKVKKTNFGIDYSFFKGMVTGKADFFRDRRTDILILGANRAIPSYFGVDAPVANLGIVENKGYELELAFNKRLGQNWRLWANLNYTHAKDKVIEADDAQLLPEYQKRANKQISQSYSYVSAGNYNTWDELYGSTIHDNNDGQKLPGNYYIIDYNGDGIIDSKDNIPYGFPSNPQNTYNATFGVDWKGFSLFVQLYGVNNVTRQVVFSSLAGQNHLVYNEGSYWSKDNPNADVPLPRWLSTASGYTSGNRYMYDGSYIRLKNAELAYTFEKSKSFIKRIGMESLRVYVNGNNLYVWTKMPDDRESNFAGTGWASQGAYPTVKRFNIGANITF